MPRTALLSLIASCVNTSDRLPPLWPLAVTLTDRHVTPEWLDTFTQMALLDTHRDVLSHPDPPIRAVADRLPPLPTPPPLPTTVTLRLPVVGPFARTTLEELGRSAVTVTLTLPWSVPTVTTTTEPDPVPTATLPSIALSDTHRLDSVTEPPTRPLRLCLDLVGVRFVPSSVTDMAPLPATLPRTAELGTAESSDITPVTVPVSRPCTLTLTGSSNDHPPLLSLPYTHDSATQVDASAPQPRPARIVTEFSPASLLLLLPDPTTVTLSDPVVAVFTRTHELRVGKFQLTSRLTLLVDCRATDATAPPSPEIADAALHTSPELDTHTDASCAVPRSRTLPEYPWSLPWLLPSTVTLAEPVVARLLIAVLLAAAASALKARVIDDTRTTALTAASQTVPTHEGDLHPSDELETHTLASATLRPMRPRELSVA